MLFVGTKRQASEPVATAAKRCAQYYVNHRWLGGTLTNWRTISGVDRAAARTGRRARSPESSGRTKKELLQLTRERDKLELSLGGIKDMGGIPDLMFVIDTNKEAIAIQEARKLNIPVVAILDTNCDPDGITYPIPGNDDAARALQLYCDLVADSVLDGLTEGQAALGVDIGAAEAPVEPALRRSTAKAAAAAAPQPEPEPEPEPAIAEPSRQPRRRSPRPSPIPPPRRRTRQSLRASPRRKAELFALRTSRLRGLRTDTLTGGKTMADITAGMVKDLRETTGAGMMDCKKALAGDRRRHEAAIDWLRAKGLAKAAKKADRVAAEGVVAVATATTAPA